MTPLRDAWSPTPQSATTVYLGRQAFDRAKLETAWLLIAEHPEDRTAPARALLAQGWSIGECVELVAAAREWTGNVVGGPRP